MSKSRGNMLQSNFGCMLRSNFKRSESDLKIIATILQTERISLTELQTKKLTPIMHSWRESITDRDIAIILI